MQKCKIITTLKMGGLKWITRKEFEACLRIKEFMEKNNFEEVDLRKKILDRRPIPLMIRSNDMKPKKYECIKEAANDIKVPREIFIHAYENIEGRLLLEGKGELKSFVTSNGYRDSKLPVSGANYS